MNLPNTLSLIRVIFAFIIPFFLISPELSSRIITLILFLIAAFTDLFDGKIARKKNIVTTFGKIIDPIADKFLFLFVFYTFFYLGLYPFWVFIPFLVREVLVTVARLYALKKGKAIAAEKLGKIKTGTQFTLLGFLYILLLSKDHINFINSVDILIQYLVYLLLVGAMYLTLHSGIAFFIKNWKTLR